MKNWVVLFVLFFCSACTSCSEQEEKPMLTPNGAFRAEIGRIDSQVARINGRADLQRIALDSLERLQLSTEYPFWADALVYRSKEGLHKTELKAKPSESNMREELYFGDQGKLIYAVKAPDSSSEGERYYFLLEKLVMVLDEKGNKKDIQSDSVKLSAMLLVNEARNFRKVMASKKIKP